MNFQDTHPTHLRTLLDELNRAAATHLHAEAGEPTRVHRHGEAIPLSDQPLSGMEFRALIAPLHGATDTLVMASAGWYRVVIDGTKLIARAIPSRMTYRQPTESPA